MLPIAPLMIEHRIIEKMIGIIENEVDWCDQNGSINIELIDFIIDFIKNYGDRCHHGKEEAILFRELKKKQMSQAHTAIMKELMEEHLLSKAKVVQLADAQTRYVAGDKMALPQIMECLKFIKTLYPAHIEREDRLFFQPAMDYFSAQELDELLKEEMEFDRHIIHRIYRDKIDNARRLLSCT
ncbi:MAG: hemerythrin domain-containing protein [Syntrophorhabdaceae bacterium]